MNLRRDNLLLNIFYFLVLIFTLGCGEDVSETAKCPEVSLSELDEAKCLERMQLPAEIDSFIPLLYFLDSLGGKSAFNLASADTIAQLYEVITKLEKYPVEEYGWSMAYSLIFRASFGHAGNNHGEVLKDASAAIDILEQYEIQDECTWAYLSTAHNLASLAHTGNSNTDNAVASAENAILYNRKAGLADKNFAAYINMGMSYAQVGNAEKALPWYERAECLLTTLTPNSLDSVDVALFYNNYAHALDVQSQSFKEQLKPYQAEEYRLLSLEYGRRGMAWVGDEAWAPRFFESSMLNIYNTAFTYTKMLGTPGASDSARYYLDLCNEKIGEIPFNSPNLENTVRYIGPRHYACAAALDGDEKEMLLQINKAIDQLIVVGDQNEPSVLLSKRYYLDFLFTKGNLLKVCADKKEDNIPLLKKSYEAYKKGFDFLDEFVKELVTTSSLKLFLDGRVFYFSEAFEVALELYKKTKEAQYLSDAFQIAERGRNFVLRNGIYNQMEAWEKGDLLNDLAKEERKYVEIITQRELELRQRPMDESALQNLRKAKQDYSLFVQRLSESSNPDEKNYFLNRFQNTVPSLSQVQAWLPDEKTAIIEYQIGLKKGWAMSISKQKVNVSEFEIDSTFHALVKNYAESMRGEKEYFREYSWKLYQHTFQETGRNLPESISTLLIVPHGLLSDISFEGLLEVKSPNEPYNELEYLAGKYNILHHYSVAGLMNLDSLQNIRPKAEYYFAAFNSDMPDSTYGDLSCGSNQLVAMEKLAKETVERFSQSHTAHFYERTTMSSFSENIDKYKMVQLILHGCPVLGMDEGYYLEFYPVNDTIAGRLMVSEIYNLKLKNDLVVLSNCRTAQGEVTLSEGVMSLARAFSYAGCSSTIAMKSDALDIPTAEVLSYFYENIEKGQPFAIALANAKRTYFKSNSVHPWKWSNLIYIGGPKSRAVSN